MIQSRSANIKAWKEIRERGILKYQENLRNRNIEKLKAGTLYPKQKSTGRKNKKKTPRQKAIERLDKDWSLEVRKGCKCELCGREGDIGSFDAHHIKKRSNMATRWYIPNGACLCKGCHRFKVHMDTFTVAELILKLQKKRGPDWYPELVERANSIFKPQQTDFDEILKGLLELQNR